MAAIPIVDWAWDEATSIVGMIANALALAALTTPDLDDIDGLVDGLKALSATLRSVAKGADEIEPAAPAASPSPAGVGQALAASSDHPDPCGAPAVPYYN